MPVFLIEVTSPSDSLKEQKGKCEKWIEAGVQEAILLHPKTNTAYVYLPNQPLQEIPDATEMASTVLGGFVIDCLAIWEEL